MNPNTDPIENLLWIDLPEGNDLDLGNFRLNPTIPLPVEPDPDGSLNPETVTWDRVVAAMLLVLANQPAHTNADYYRSFLNALRPELQNQLANAAQERTNEGDFATAEDILLALRGLAPEDPGHRLALARIYDVRSARDEKLGNDDSAARYAEAAEAAYAELLSEDSPVEEAWFHAGMFRYRRGSFSRAAETLEAYLQMADDAEMTEEAQSILHLCRNEGQAEALYEEAYAALVSGDIAVGLDKARMFRDSRPEGWPGWFLLGWALRLSEEWNEARESLEGARLRGCRDGNLFNEIAMCARAQADYDGAKEALERALEKDPENTKILSNMAVIQMEKGDRVEAVRWLETALTLDPEDRIAAKLLQDLTN